MSNQRDPVGHLISRRLHRHGAPFSQRLTAHTSCVNALAWSGDGRWLASAGDDRRVLLWDFHPLDDLSAPLVCTGPRANILCLAFTASNNVVLSGGLDQQVFQYDVSRVCRSPRGAQGSVRGQSPQHNGTIRGITPHPHKDELFLTGSEDGSVILHDTRVRQVSRGVGSFSVNAEVTGVQYHPYMEHLFVMSDARGNCNLWDTRMTFGRQREGHQSGSIVNYVTRISKSGSSHLANPETSSVVFDSTGNRLGVTMQHYLPTIYALWDEWPMATCSGADVVATIPQEPPEPCPLSSRCSYVNACTIKNGSFGSAGRQTYYGAGSDDFRGYVWHIPDGLASFRRELSYSDWAAEPPGETIAFAKSVMGRRLVPVKLQKPHFMVCGHKSIVNTVLFHPLEPYIVTSGIERHVIVHSPFEVTPACGKLAETDTHVRARESLGSASPRPREYIYYRPNEVEEDDDERTIRLFDDILRHEGTPDVFVIRDWDEDSDSDRDRESRSGSESDSVDSEDNSPPRV